MTQTLARQFFNETAVQEALDQLTNRLAESQSNLDGIRPPKQELTEDYTDILESVESLRGRELFYPYLSSGLGNGPLVELADGSVKYDFIIGIGVHYLGHSDPNLTRSVLKGALEDTVMQGNLQQNEASIRLMEQFIEIANRHGDGPDHCFLTSSGAMANENALKILFHGRPGADRVLTFEGGFSGRSLALAQVTDKPGYREGLPETIGVEQIPFVSQSQSDQAVEEALNTLEDRLEKADRYGCLMGELIQGEGGFYPIHESYLDGIVRRLEQHDVPLLVDEVQSFGRTARPFAYQLYGIDDHVDVVTVGKLTQTCATLFRNKWNPDPGLISQTFTSSTTAIAASNHILTELTGGDYFGDNGKNSTIHDWAVEQLEAIRDRHPDLIEGPYGRGAMVGFRVLDGTKERTLQFLHRLFDNGVIGFLAGSDPTRVRFLIPGGAVSRDDVRTVFDIVEDTLREVRADQ